MLSTSAGAVPFWAPGLLSGSGSKRSLVEPLSVKALAATLLVKVLGSVRVGEQVHVFRSQFPKSPNLNLKYSSCVFLI